MENVGGALEPHAPSTIRSARRRGLPLQSASVRAATWCDSPMPHDSAITRKEETYGDYLQSGWTNGAAGTDTNQPDSRTILSDSPRAIAMLRRWR